MYPKNETEKRMGEEMPVERLRRERGLTIQQLAEVSGVPRSTCDTWCRKGAPEPVRRALRLAAALGVSVREICGEVPGDA